METDGRVALTIEDAQRLQQTKIVYVPMIISGIMVAVVKRDIGAAMLSGVVRMNVSEAIRVLAFAETKQKPKGIAMALARFVLGILIWGMLFFFVGVGVTFENFQEMMSGHH
jgi:hypothetical protein